MVFDPTDSWTDQCLRALSASSDLKTMTPDAFRALALSFPRAQEKPILGSQEFRIKDKAFATLGWPQAGWAVIKLAPAD